MLRLELDEDQVGPEQSRRLGGGHRIRCELANMTLALQHALEGAAQLGIVVDDEDAAHAASTKPTRSINCCFENGFARNGAPFTRSDAFGSPETKRNLASGCISRSRPASSWPRQSVRKMSVTTRSIAPRCSLQMRSASL